MFKDTLKEIQPIVYRTLENALRNDRLSHCYLFVGDRGTLKEETALLLAQSLVCENREDVWACEQCNSCRRIRERQYADFLFIDGVSATIKMDDIEKIQVQFSQTALEKAGRKVFIITGFENMNAKASNSLLKFIEEPANNTFGIFITSDPEKVLPTIISRCQVINFRSLSKESLYQEGLKLNLDSLNAHVLANIVHSRADIAPLSKNEAYLKALNYFTEFMALYFTNPTEARLYLQDDRFRSRREQDRRKDRECFGYFLDIASLFVNDYHENYSGDDDTWNSLLKTARERNFNSLRFLQATTDARNAFLRSANLLLMVDQFIYRIQKDS